jgi:hypothetical protein
MKGNKDILDEFGQKVISNSFDPAIKNLISLKTKENPPAIFKDYVELFKKMNENDFGILKKYIQESLGNHVYNFLKIFEENEQFKIVYEENGQQVDLNKISEMLKAEPIIENGWIQRYSKTLNNETT